MLECCVFISLMDTRRYTQNVSTYFKYSGTFSTLGTLQNATNISIDVHVHDHGQPSGDFHI